MGSAKQTSLNPFLYLEEFLLSQVAESESYFAKPKPVDGQIKALVAEGFTVYVAPGVHKVKYGEKGTLEFKPFFRHDSIINRPIVDGGFYATKDPDEMAHIDKIRELSVVKYSPEPAMAKAGK